MQIGNAVLYNGWGKDVLPTLAADSIDSVVCDPPYGLSKEPNMAEVLTHWLAGDDYAATGGGFMGKSWDSFVPGPATWREIARVLKPGGYALVFAGSRTVDLMAVSLRLAGFEIRDQIQWVYAQGFPKSLNFACKCAGGTVPYTHEKTKQTTECDVYPLRNSDVPQTLDSCERRGEVLQPSLQKQGAPTSGWTELPAAENGGTEPGLEGGCDHVAEAGELQTDQVRPVPCGFPPDGEKGRVCDGAPVGDGAEVREVLESRGSGAPQGPRPAQQCGEQLGTIPEQHGTQERGMAQNQKCPKCGGVLGWQGWGTALKPAHEPIIVARKPLIGTVAANILAHGVGGLNIDGCRVETDDNLSFGSRQLGDGVKYGVCKPSSEGIQNALGRFPANLIHDGSDEVLACFPDAPGQQCDVSTTAPSSKTSNVYGAMSREGEPSADSDNEGAVGFKMKPGARRLDSGSAARFFYCAKASKSDRGEGNTHPTVKPQALMRYLVRLVTPPSGTVLDSFAGSGSTGVAALAEGFHPVLIEQDTDHFNTALGRIWEAVYA